MCKVFFIRSRLVASVLILLCGGAVYAQQPATRYLSDDIPKAWTPDTLFSQQLPPEDLWWSGFNDACLDTLIQEAVDSNHNLLAAADRIRMARAAWRMEQSGFYPSVNFSAGFFLLLFQFRFQCIDPGLCLFHFFQKGLVHFRKLNGIN